MSGENLTVECSPGTYARVQTDPEFLQQLMESVEASSVSTHGIQQGPLNSIIECEYTDILPLEEDIDVANSLFQGTSSSTVWVEAAVKLTLSLVAELRPKLGKSIELKNKLKMWKTIELKMTEKGFNYTHIQIENKYRALERSFKKTKQHNKRTGRDRAVCAYEKELAEILNERPSVFPSIIVGPSAGDVLRKNDLLRAGERSSDMNFENNASTSGKENELSNFSDVETPSPKPKKKKTEEFLEELKDLIQTQSTNILKEIKKSNQLKEERNEILRSLVGSSRKN